MKKFILSLFVGFVGIISFCSASYIGNFTYNSISVGANSTVSGFISGSDLSILCFRLSYPSFSCNLNNYFLDDNSVMCFYSDDISYSCVNNSTARILYYEKIDISSISGFNCPICPSCQTCTGYNLNVVYPGIMTDTYLINSDINLNVGQNISVDTLSFPNISLSSTCQNLSGEICGSGDLLRSNIYINNILHPGRQFVNIEIPDYIQWDYSVGDDDFNLYVGSGYDVDYIESVIDINSYRPTSEDFTNIFVSGLTLVMPYIVIALFIIFVRKLLKRIFK